MADNTDKNLHQASDSSFTGEQSDEEDDRRPPSPSPPGIRYAVIEETSDEVFDSLPVIVIGTDGNNNDFNRSSAAQVVPTDHQPPESHIANATVNNPVLRNGPTESFYDPARFCYFHYRRLQRRCHSLPNLRHHTDAWKTFCGRSYCQLFHNHHVPPVRPPPPERPARPTQLFFSGTVPSGTAVSQGRFRTNRIGPVNPAEHFPGYLLDRGLAERPSKRGFDCFWLPDFSWKLSYKAPKCCRRLVQYGNASNFDNQFLESNKTSEVNHPSWAPHNLQITAPLDGQPFDMFSYHQIRALLLTVLSVNYRLWPVYIGLRGIIQMEHALRALAMMTSEMTLGRERRITKQEVIFVGWDAKKVRKMVTRHHYLHFNHYSIQLELINFILWFRKYYILFFTFYRLKFLFG